MRSNAAKVIAIVATISCVTHTLPANADAPPPSSGVSVSLKVDLLRQFADAIGAAGDAVSKLADGIKHAVDTGVTFQNEKAARDTHDRLLALSKDLLEFRSLHNGITLSEMDQFLAMPNAEAWAAVVERARATLSDALQLQEKLKAENSEFVLKPAYETLYSAFSSRVTLLHELASLPYPRSAAELSIVREADRNYRILVANTARANNEMNRYIESLDKR
jgi:cellobiose-specific phosphotransferase system component IIA